MTADAHALTATAPAVDAHAATTHYRRGISNTILGMILFITSEVMFFSGLFAAYFATRAANSGNGVAWPPKELGHVLDPLGPILIATILLITSSFTCQFAVWSIRKGDRKGFIRNISITFVLGIIFLGMQVFDYTLLFGEGMTLGSGPFGTTYFTLTGFHGAHVFGGVLMLGVILYRGMSGQFSSKHHDAVEAVSLYWHFVDVVWILLFSILYLIP
ncbi:MAG TPA: heme-copper oxidase subunit III [Candidatus Limnocylindrales bacterium]|nr:heme-copper oxidase subunit III [Candidatus Limnocylindrales bacterium]